MHSSGIPYYNFFSYLTTHQFLRASSQKANGIKKKFKTKRKKEQIFYIIEYLNPVYSSLLSMFIYIVLQHIYTYYSFYILIHSLVNRNIASLYFIAARYAINSPNHEYNEIKLS